MKAEIIDSWDDYIDDVHSTIHSTAQSNDQDKAQIYKHQFTGPPMPKRIPSHGDPDFIGIDRGPKNDIVTKLEKEKCNKERKISDEFQREKDNNKKIFKEVTVFENNEKTIRAFIHGSKREKERLLSEEERKKTDCPWIKGLPLEQFLRLLEDYPRHHDSIYSFIDLTSHEGRTSLLEYEENINKNWSLSKLSEIILPYSKRIQTFRPKKGHMEQSEDGPIIRGQRIEGGYIKFDRNNQRGRFSDVGTIPRGQKVGSDEKFQLKYSQEYKPSKIIDARSDSHNDARSDPRSDPQSDARSDRWVPSRSLHKRDFSNEQNSQSWRSNGK
jgi:hypothetical protein